MSVRQFKFFLPPSPPQNKLVHLTQVLEQFCSFKKRFHCAAQSQSIDQFPPLFMYHFVTLKVNLQQLKLLKLAVIEKLNTLKNAIFAFIFQLP